ncbi:MAG: hypothetical protein ACFFCQ_13255 [Promethearchaeota archaeon]
MDEINQLRARIQELEAQLRAKEGTQPQLREISKPELAQLIEQSRDKIDNLKKSLKEEKDRNLQAQIQIEQLTHERDQAIKATQSSTQMHPTSTPVGSDKEIARLLSVAKIQIEKLQSSMNTKDETIRALNQKLVELTQQGGSEVGDIIILKEQLTQARNQALESTAQVEDLQHKLEMAAKRADKFHAARKLAKKLSEELKLANSQKEKLEAELKLASRASEPLVINKHIQMILNETIQGKIVYYLAIMGEDSISIRKLARILEIPPVHARKEINYLSDREIVEIFDEGQFVRLVQ